MKPLSPWHRRAILVWLWCLLCGIGAVKLLAPVVRAEWRRHFPPASISLPR